MVIYPWCGAGEIWDKVAAAAGGTVDRGVRARVRQAESLAHVRFLPGLSDSERTAYRIELDTLPPAEMGKPRTTLPRTHDQEQFSGQPDRLLFVILRDLTLCFFPYDGANE